MRLRVPPPSSSREITDWVVPILSASARHGTKPVRPNQLHRYLKVPYPTEFPSHLANRPGCLGSSVWDHIRGPAWQVDGACGEMMSDSGDGTDAGGSQLTRAHLAVVERVAKALARSRKYQTPSGSRSWGPDDVDDLVGDFFVDPTNNDDLLGGDQSEGELARRATVRMKQLLVERRRGGPVGAMWRRIERRMRVRSDVADVEPRHWALSGFESQSHWMHGDDPLDAAANLEPVDPPPKWDEESKRQGPNTTTGTVDRLCTAVLAMAQAPVERPCVCRVVTKRVVPTDPTTVMQSPENPAEPWDAEHLDGDERSAAREVAEEIWFALSADERSLVFTDTPVRDLAEQGVLGLGRTALNNRRSKLRESVGAAVQAAPNRDLLLEELEVLMQVSTVGGQDDGGEP
jgi:hypothetical protein